MLTSWWRSALTISFKNYAWKFNTFVQLCYFYHWKNIQWIRNEHLQQGLTSQQIGNTVYLTIKDWKNVWKLDLQNIFQLYNILSHSIDISPVFSHCIHELVCLYLCTQLVFSSSLCCEDPYLIKIWPLIFCYNVHESYVSAHLSWTKFFTSDNSITNIEATKKKSENSHMQKQNLIIVWWPKHLQRRLAWERRLKPAFTAPHNDPSVNWT